MTPLDASPPPAPYRPSRLDRDPDAIDQLRRRTAGVAVGVGTTVLVFAASAMLESHRSTLLATLATLATFARAVVAGLVAGVGTTWLARAASDGASSAFLAIVFPTGKSCPSLPEQSRLDALDALAARGDMASALAGYEDAMRAAPHDVAVRVRAAELYARGGEATRAASIFRELRALPSCTASDDVYATNRLVDLYLGALGTPRRALRELRRLADLHPASPAGAAARAAIIDLKARVEFAA